MKLKGFTLKGLLRWIAIMAVLACMGISNTFCPPAEAEEDNTWLTNVGAGTGMSFTGESFTTLDVVAKTPEDAPEWFTIALPSEGIYRHRFTPEGREINYAMFKYDVGEYSNQFFGSVFMETNPGTDDIIAPGIGYENIGEHWGVPELDGITLSAHINNNDGYIAGIDIEKAISDGYGILTHGVLYFDSNFTHDKSNIEAGFFHNMKKDASLRLEICYAVYGHESFGYFVMKGNVDLLKF